MGWFTRGLEGFLGADIDIDAHKLEGILLDCNNAGPAAGAWKITNVTYSAPYVTVTTQANHNMLATHEVEVFSVAGISNVNGQWTIFDIPGPTQFRFTPSSTPTGTYTSSGFIVGLSSVQYESEINVATNSVMSSRAEFAFAGRGKAHGVLDLPDITFTSVTHGAGGTVQVLAIIKSGTTPGGASDAATARRLVAALTPQTPGMTGLPATPNATNLNYTVPTQGVGRI